mgnify:CR=1 FL=1
MKLTIATAGSRGDAQPYVALALGLRAAGHEVKIAGDPEFEAYRARWKANNYRWLKTTLAQHTEAGPRISYQEVDTSLYPPTEPRDYR